MNLLVNTFVIMAIMVIVVLFIIASTINIASKDAKNKRSFYGMPKQKR